MRVIEEEQQTISNYTETLLIIFVPIVGILTSTYIFYKFYQKKKND